MKSADGSEWMIDNRSLEKILENDPQKLIQCTEPDDRVVLNLIGVHKFKKTLVVFHNLEFVSKSPQVGDNNNAPRGATTFTCPDGGPFIRIKYGTRESFFCCLRNCWLFRSIGFNASGFVIQNCTESSGEGAIVIESRSRVTIKTTEFNGNQKRAIYIASYTSLTLKSCYFEKNGNHDDLGGAIRVLNSASLSIFSSSFYGTSHLRIMDSFFSTSKVRCQVKWIL